MLVFCEIYLLLLRICCLHQTLLAILILLTASHMQMVDENQLSVKLVKSTTLELNNINMSLNSGASKYESKCHTSYQIIYYTQFPSFSDGITTIYSIVWLAYLYIRHEVFQTIPNRTQKIDSYPMLCHIIIHIWCNHIPTNIHAINMCYSVMQMVHRVQSAT